MGLFRRKQKSPAGPMYYHPYPVPVAVMCGFCNNPLCETCAMFAPQAYIGPGGMRHFVGGQEYRAGGARIHEEDCITCDYSDGEAYSDDDGHVRNFDESEFRMSYSTSGTK